MIDDDDDWSRANWQAILIRDWPPCAGQVKSEDNGFVQGGLFESFPLSQMASILTSSVSI